MKNIHQLNRLQLQGFCHGNNADDAFSLCLQDIGDGWWEGQLENGEVGLFPESYVEVTKITYSPSLYGYHSLTHSLAHSP